MTETIRLVSANLYLAYTKIFTDNRTIATRVAIFKSQTTEEFFND